MRKYLIGMIAALAGALALSSVASADVTSVGIVSNVTPAKQNKKVRGPANIFFQSSDTHAGNRPCPLGTANSPSCYAFPPSVQSSITFPKDLKFTAGNIPDCSLSRIVGQSSASARAACAGSIVGGGGNVQAFSDGRKLNGTITAFNGAPSGGNAVAVPARRVPGRRHEADPERRLSGQQPDGADPAGPGLGDRCLQHRAQRQEGRREEQEDRQEDDLRFDQVLDREVDDHRNGHATRTVSRCRPR